VVAITPDVINTAELLASVADPAAGAVDLFLGVVRDHSEDRPVRGLKYEAYPEMATRMLRRIVEDAGRRWPTRRISVVHRVGRLEVGEVSVGIAVSADHRAEAFEACRWIIEQIKASVPIWKKELSADGEAWVGIVRPEAQLEPADGRSEPPCPS